MDTPPDARAILSRLVGSTIPTMTGVSNDVLRIEGHNVIVGTGRSPEGKPVEIADIQAAIDMLWRDGSLTVDVPTVGRRSAFIGAVLQTLPGTVATVNPRVITLQRKRPPR